MEIKCPSCGTSYQTEKYHGAFEIECSCGYSILLPDESAFKKVPLSRAFDQPPSALDEEDSAAVINVEDNSEAPLESADEMTQDESLPDGMVYDPFEAENLKDKPMESGDASSDSILSGDEVFSEGSPFEISPEEVDGEINFDEKPESSSDEESTEEPQTPREILDRIRLAEVGERLGESFDIEFLEMNKEQLQKIYSHGEQMLAKFPWLKKEMENRSLDLRNLSIDEKIENLPEVLALQLYLKAYDLGGRCSYKITSNQ